MTKRGSGFLDAAKQILQERGEPMRGEEIIRIGLERGLFTTMARDEEAAYSALISTLHSTIARGSNSRGFVRYGNSTFGLAEWGDSVHPPATTQSRLRRGTRRSVRGEPPERSTISIVPQGVTLEMLEQTRQAMSADQFRQIWGGIYEQVLAEERRRAITPVSDRLLAEKARAIVQRIQDFLQGRSTESPKSETVCDWIFVCYNLELYREGAALWRYVNKDDVNAWQYERTAKFSTACRARVGL